MYRQPDASNIVKYSYDGYGNVLTSTHQKSGDNAFIKTATAYTVDGNYPASTTDARGNAITQEVNPTDGTLTSVTDPNGQTVNYTYDDSKRVKSVQTTDGDKTYKNEYTYENDRIKTVRHNTTDEDCDVTYTFDYDELGRKTSVKVGEQVLSTNVYGADRSGLLSEVQYGNGGKVKYAYDDYDRPIGVKYDEESEDRYTYEYNASGNAVMVRDNHLGRVFQTEHDLTDRLMGTQLRNADGSLIYRTELDYDTQNRLVGFGEETENDTYKTSYTYDNDNRVTEIGFGGDDKVKYTYDSLGRVSTRVAENGTDAGKLTSTYTFVDGGHGAGSTTPLIKKIDQPHIPFEYIYDNRDNIINEKRGDLTTTYAYDALGQLIRVNDPHENATWVYHYDCGGNILSKAKYAYTTGTLDSALETIPYVYGDANWKDKLTSYNGHPITYDAIGNPLNDGTWTYIWSAGRQLKQMSKPGMTVEFKYNHDGLRTRKKVTEHGTTTMTDYIYHGKLLAHITVGNDNLHFFYDAQSRPAKVNFNGTIYTYVHSLQGDIVGILDGNGNLVIEYQYNMWGESLGMAGPLKATLGKANPFRYRGYVYDEEAELYYLKSRYYVAMQNRMLSADDLLVPHRMLGCALYQYCKNNPVGRIDPNGRDGLNATSLTSFGAAVAQFIWKNVPAYVEKLKRLTKPERILSCNYPAAALVVNRASEKASAYTNKLFKSSSATLPTNVDGSIANGFKHAMWNALTTKHSSAAVAEAFATAHESDYIGNYGEYLSSTLDAHANMDLYYNHVGRTVAVQNPNVTDGKLAMLVLSAVLNDPSQVLNGGTEPNDEVIGLLLSSGEYDNF